MRLKCVAQNVEISRVSLEIVREFTKPLEVMPRNQCRYFTSTKEGADINSFQNRGKESFGERIKRIEYIPNPIKNKLGTFLKIRSSAKVKDCRCSHLWMNGVQK